MIKRLDANTSPNTSRKSSRRGFQHISQVVERLLKLYELQAEMNVQRESDQRDQRVQSMQPELVGSSTDGTQATFGWYQ